MPSNQFLPNPVGLARRVTKAAAGLEEAKPHSLMASRAATQPWVNGHKNIKPCKGDGACTGLRHPYRVHFLGDRFPGNHVRRVARAERSSPGFPPSRPTAGGDAFGTATVATAKGQTGHPGVAFLNAARICRRP
jgi:hypothetical protein